MWSRRIVQKIRQLWQTLEVEDHERENDEESMPVVEVLDTQDDAIRPTNVLGTQQQQKQQKSRRDIEDSNLPLLYHLARSWAWTPLAFRCQTHPHEACTKHVDEQSGDTALHWAVFGKPPLDVVQNLLQACPEMAKTPNLSGDLALHVACSYRASKEVICALVEAYPEAVGMPNHQGRCPLHLACNYGLPQVGAFCALLSLPEGVAVLQQDDRIHGIRPLAAWNARENLAQRQTRTNRMRLLVRNNVSSNENSSVHNSSVTNPVATTHSGTPSPQDEIQLYTQSNFWQTAAVLIVTEYEKTCVVRDAAELAPCRILRAALANRTCPPSLEEYAVLAYHNHLLDQNEDDQRVALHWAALCTSSDLVLELLELCPQACHVRDAQGEFPLILALQNPSLSWFQGIQRMVEVNPEAVAELEDTRALFLLPTILARLKPSTLFPILKACPTVLNHTSIT